MPHASSASADGELGRVEVALTYSPRGMLPAAAPGKWVASSLLFTCCSWKKGRATATGGGNKAPWYHVSPQLLSWSWRGWHREEAKGNPSTVLFSHWLMSSSPINHLHQIVVLQFWVSSIWVSCSILAFACIRGRQFVGGNGTKFILWYRCNRTVCNTRFYWSYVALNEAPTQLPPRRWC